MAKMHVSVPEAGMSGDIESALIKAGFGRLDNQALAEHLLCHGGGFKVSFRKLVNDGIDPKVMANELRAAGLAVRMQGD